MKLRLMFLVVASFVLVTGSAIAQTGRHSEITAKEGDLYMFMKVGAPITPEQLHFMSKVNKYKNLRVLTHFQQMNDQELKDWHENPQDYTKRYVDPDVQFEEKTAKKYISNTGQFNVNRLENLSMIEKLGVRSFPRIIYLTPDGFVYDFPFMPFKSEGVIKDFWAAYEKHKNQGKKMWLEKQWGVSQ
ncbi:MAG: hypothetical protein CMF61_06040 [Magnetococcales bacterium]|nr:hypothetical protein [Magnetococcales bacterium]